MEEVISLVQRYGFEAPRTGRIALQPCLGDSPHHCSEAGQCARGKQNIESDLGAPWQLDFPKHQSRYGEQAEAQKYVYDTQRKADVIVKYAGRSLFQMTGGHDVPSAHRRVALKSGKEDGTNDEYN